VRFEDGLELSVYYGERDRRHGHLLSDLLLDAFERHGARAAALLRGTEGFGIKHQLHTERLLTLSEDLPLVASAVAAPEAVEALRPEVEELVEEGLVTIERLRVAREPPPRGARGAGPGADGGEGSADAKLTLYLGRGERLAGRAAYAVAVDALRRHGVAGATVLFGVDGVVHHARRRGRFLSRNAGVPLLVVSVGASDAIEAALAELYDALDDPLATIARATVCKRDGRALAARPPLPGTDGDGLGLWEKVTVYTGEQARHGRRPLYVDLVHRLRLEGAAGATAVRGIWGYSGDHAPHGDRLLAVRRRVPVVVTLVDRPERMERWWPIVDALTREQGLVTTERVPAFRATGPGLAAGGLRLAAPPD
jgi:PII-like signaling protein